MRNQAAPQRQSAADIARALVVLERRRLERLLCANGMSRKTAAQVAQTFFADALQQGS